MISCLTSPRIELQVPHQQDVAISFGENLTRIYTTLFPTIIEAAAKRLETAPTSPLKLSHLEDIQITTCKVSSLGQSIGCSAQISSLKASKKFKDIGFFNFVLSTKEDGTKVTKFDEVKIEDNYQNLKLFNVFHSAYTETIKQFGVNTDYLIVNSSLPHTANLYRNKGYQLDASSLKALSDEGISVEDYFSDSSVTFNSPIQICMVRNLMAPIGTPTTSAETLSKKRPLNVLTDLNDSPRKTTFNKMKKIKKISSPRKVKISPDCFSKKKENISPPLIQLVSVDIAMIPYLKPITLFVLSKIERKESLVL